MKPTFSQFAKHRSPSPSKKKLPLRSLLFEATHKCQKGLVLKRISNKIRKNNLIRNVIKLSLNNRKTMNVIASADRDFFFNTRNSNIDDERLFILLNIAFPSITWSYFNRMTRHFIIHYLWHENPKDPTDKSRYIIAIAVVRRDLHSNQMFIEYLTTHSNFRACGFVSYLLSRIIPKDTTIALCSVESATNVYLRLGFKKTIDGCPTFKGGVCMNLEPGNFVPSQIKMNTNAFSANSSVSVNEVSFQITIRKLLDLLPMCSKELKQKNAKTSVETLVERLTLMLANPKGQSIAKALILINDFFVLSIKFNQLIDKIIN